MYSFKYAVRAEANTHQSKAQAGLATETLPDHFKDAGQTAAGQWYRIELPASVWCLLVVAGDQSMSAYYHSPHDLDLELSEAFNAKKKTRAK